MFWGSTMEICMFLLGFILFCVVPGLMGFIWLHIFHVIRGILGYLLLKKLPRSHDIVEKLSVTDNHYSIEQMTNLLKDNISRIFMSYTEECKKLLLAYCLVTVAAFFFDLVEFLI